MPISDAQYQTWLQADNKTRVVLVEAEAYSGGSVVTRYMSDCGFVSAATDTPANTAYDDIVLAVPSIRSVMADALRGRSVVSYGDIEIDNSAGSRDTWLLDAWDGRPIRLYLGDAAWSKADFRLILNGVTQDIRSSDTATVTLRLRDRQGLLDVPMQSTFVGGTGPAVFQRLPIGYGQILYAAPVLIDAATREYQIHDGQIESIDAVYVDGTALTPGTGYTNNLAAGKFTLAVAAVGTITVDFKGSKTAGVYVNTASLIAQRIVQERAGFTSGDIHAAAASDFAIDAPAVVGVYVTEDHRTVLSVLDELVGGVGGFYAVNRDGQLVLGQFKAPAGTAVLTLIDDDLELGGLELIRRDVPLKSVRLGYARYFTVVDTSAIAGLSAQARQRMAKEYLIKRATTGAVGHLLAVDGDIERSPIALDAAATTEAARQATLWGVLRRIFRLKVFTTTARVNLNDVVALSLSRYGLTSGTLARVVAMRDDVSGGTRELEVFL